MNEAEIQAIKDGLTEAAEEFITLQCVLGMPPEQAALRVIDIAFIAKHTGMAFKHARKICYDTHPGFTKDLEIRSFKIGYKMAGDLVRLRQELHNKAIVEVRNTLTPEQVDVQNAMQ